MFVCFEGVRELGHLVWVGGTLGVWAADKATLGEGVGILTPPYPCSWPGCPTLAGCRPPISVGHQGNRATLGSEPGDAQPRLGLGSGGGSLKSHLQGPAEPLGPKPPTQAVLVPTSPHKPVWGSTTLLLYMLFESHSPNPPRVPGVVCDCEGWGRSQRQEPCVWGGRGASAGGWEEESPLFLLPSWQ